MAFMEPDIEHATFVHVEDSAGTYIVPQDIVGPEPQGGYTPAMLRPFHGDIDAPDYSIRTGWYARYTAPGYLDATDYIGPYSSEDEARAALVIYAPGTEISVGAEGLAADSEPEAVAALVWDLRASTQHMQDEIAERGEDGVRDALLVAAERACLYARSVCRSAADAEELALLAVEAARAGDLDTALGRAEEAEVAERQWGDAPTWGRLVETIEAAIEARDEEE